MDPIIPQTALPNNEISHGPSDDEEPSQPDEGEVAEEIRREYSWLPTLLAENETKAWGTAYRDFVEVRLLLVAVQGLNIEEMGNNQLTKGVFLSEGREFTLSVWEFIDILQLAHSSATWRNKVTAYFRIKQLYMFAQYNGGDITFQTPEHRPAWKAVQYWMDHREKVLEPRWETTRYGSKELHPLLQTMVMEVCYGKLISIWITLSADRSSKVV